MLPGWRSADPICGMFARPLRSYAENIHGKRIEVRGLKPR